MPSSTDFAAPLEDPVDGEVAFEKLKGSGGIGLRLATLGYERHAGKSHGSAGGSVQDDAGKGNRVGSLLREGNRGGREINSSQRKERRIRIRCDFRRMPKQPSSRHMLEQYNAYFCELAAGQARRPVSLGRLMLGFWL
jgi:hypothetical protein